MKLTVNGEPCDVKDVATLADLLQTLDEKARRFAIAVNGGFIPRAEYGATKLNENDDIEIVAPFPGG